MVRSDTYPQACIGGSGLRPPWSTEAGVRAGCTSCGACISACPEGILFAGRAGAPVVRFDTGICTFCRKCADACEQDVFAGPDQAPWDIAASIGEACLLGLNVTCQSCVDACETEALRLDYRAGRVGAIAVAADQCTGCGGCLSVCPTQAISLQPSAAADAA